MEIDTLKSECKRHTYIEKKLSKKNKQLEAELESALKRVSFRGRRNSSGKSRNNSPYSKNRGSAKRSPNSRYGSMPNRKRGTGTRSGYGNKIRDRNRKRYGGG